MRARSYGPLGLSSTPAGCTHRSRERLGPANHQVSWAHKPPSRLLRRGPGTTGRARKAPSSAPSYLGKSRKPSSWNSVPFGYLSYFICDPEAVLAQRGEQCISLGRERVTGTNPSLAGKEPTGASLQQRGAHPLPDAGHELPTFLP